jgi:hypothetical protein
MSLLSLFHPKAKATLESAIHTLNQTIEFAGNLSENFFKDDQSQVQFIITEQKKHDEPSLHEEKSAAETFLMEGHRYMEKHRTGTLEVSDQKIGCVKPTTNTFGMTHLSISSIGELFIDVQQRTIFPYLLDEYQVMNFKLIWTKCIFCECETNYNFTTE